MIFLGGETMPSVMLTVQEKWANSISGRNIAVNQNNSLLVIRVVYVPMPKTFLDQRYTKKNTFHFLLTTIQLYNGLASGHQI